MSPARAYNRKQVLKFPWSPLQLHTFEQVQSGKGHIVVESVAGSGKTRTIEGIAASIPPKTPILIIAFNRHIAEELSRRIPKSIATVSTAHKIGKMLIVRYFGGKKIRIEEKKYRQISRQLIDSLQQAYAQYSDLQYQDLELAELTYPVPPPDVDGGTPADKARTRALRWHLEKLIHFVQVSLTQPTVEAIQMTAHHYGLDVKRVADCSLEQIETWLYPLVIQALQIGEEQAAQRLIGLDDLVWLPEQWNLDPPPTPKAFVIADEAQDSSTAIAALYRRLAGDSGRIILLGDGAQSIMGFAGSSPEVWEQFKTELQPTLCPLHICYRCPSSHLDLARYFVPQIQARPNAPVGRIEVLAIDELINQLSAGDLVLCRFNTPLVKTCLKLIQRGIKARVRGRNVAEQLTALAEDAVGSKPFSDQFCQQVRLFCQPQINFLRAEEEDDQADLIEDQRDALIACYEGFGRQCSHLKMFCDRIDNIFCDDDDRPPITLSSIHRAKGDQAHRVAILGSNLLPYLCKAKRPWQRQQEKNLAYVALTRSLADPEVEQSGTLFLVPIEWTGYHANWLDHPYGGMPITPVAEPEHHPDSEEPPASVEFTAQLSLFS